MFVLHVVIVLIASDKIINNGFAVCRFLIAYEAQQLSR